MLQNASTPSFGYFFMLALSACIATMGLISDNAPAIIGAMIIAPLMAPIMSLSFGIVITDRVLIFRSVLSIVIGILLVVGFAYVSTELIGLRVTGSEILNRTSPTLLDLIIAVAAGAAAAFAYTRKSILNSIAGVAIAVALVPPLAVTGIGLALGVRASTDTGQPLAEFGLNAGGLDIATGSMLLFVTNFIGIIAFAIIVFLAQKYGSWRKALLGLVVFAVVALFLVEPLGDTFNTLYVKSRTLRLLANLRENHPDIISGTAQFTSVQVNYRHGVVYIKAKGLVEQGEVAATEGQQRLDVFRAYLRSEINRPLVIDIELIPIQTIHLHSQSNDAEKITQSNKN
jgi:uncharacterized hydrophobic protein (TIGR00271 family)